MKQSITKDSKMDILDVLISAHYYLASENKNENFWSNHESYPEIIPLYNKGGETIAFYVTLTEGGYAVINNNLNNPTTIEFGDKDNPLIREILDKSENPHIIYNNPFSLYDYNDDGATTRTNKQETGFYEFYPDLKVANNKVANAHAQQRVSIDHILDGTAATYGNGNYGFVNWDDMPSGGHVHDSLPMSGVSWVITSDFGDIANNHCGATAVTNLAMYFSKNGFPKLKKESNRDTFIAVHNIVGDGPVITIADKAEEYFTDCGYTLNYDSISTYDELKKAIRKDKPCGILLAEGIVEWHWILGVGYRIYVEMEDEKYIQIMDGWNRNVNRFYKPYSGSLWVSATAYWM